MTWLQKKNSSLAWLNRLVRLLPIAVMVFSCLGSAMAIAEEKVKFAMGVGTKTVGTLLFWLAAKKGLFDDLGLDVQPI